MTDVFESAREGGVGGESCCDLVCLDAEKGGCHVCECGVCGEVVWGFWGVVNGCVFVCSYLVENGF